MSSNAARSGGANSGGDDEVQRLVKSGEFVKALELADSPAGGSRSDAHRLATKGWILYEMKDYVGAVGVFEESLRLKPEAPTTLFFLARAREHTGDLSGALEAYQLSFGLKPRADVLINVGLILKFQGNLDGSRKAFLEAIRLDPANETAVQLLADL